MRPIPLVGAVLATSALLSCFSPRLSYANGRFPAADQLVVDPVDSSHVVLRTTYGILGSSDAGTSWRWTCEDAVGYGGTQDPAIGVLADGTVLAGIFEGLAITHDRSCSWAFAQGLLAGEYVIDVSVHHDDPSRAVAVTSTGAGSTFHVIVAETNDNGVTWTQAGTDVATDLIALTVDVAPSNPDRIYVSGIVSPSYEPAIERSDDRGATWTRTYLDPAFVNEVPFIAAIDQTNPDRVYVRSSGTDTDHLLVSDDGALTFVEAFNTASDLLGFALSPDGTRVAIGSPMDGIHMADATDLAFTKVSDVQARCLTWTKAGIYACGNEFVDGFTLGFSMDEGQTFDTLYRLADVCQADCPADSSTRLACESAWAPLAATLDVDRAACGEIVDGASSASSSSSGGTPRPLQPAGGCSCRVHPTHASNVLALLGASSLLAIVAFRRRRSAKARLGQPAPR